MKIIFISVALTLLSCAAHGPITGAADAKARALRYVNGTVQSANPDDAEARWQVSITQKDGAAILVELADATGDLVEMSDVTGPFDYDLVTLPGLLTVKAAEARGESYQDGSLIAWKLENEGAGWQWEVYVRDAAGALHEVRMDGASGELVSEQIKDMID